MLHWCVVMTNAHEAILLRVYIPPYFVTYLDCLPILTGNPIFSRGSAPAGNHGTVLVPQEVWRGIRLTLWYTPVLLSAYIHPLHVPTIVGLYKGDRAGVGDLTALAIRD